MQIFSPLEQAEDIYRACLRHTLIKPTWYAYLLCPEWASEGVCCTALRQGKRGPPVVNITTSVHIFAKYRYQYPIKCHTLYINI